jgi:hypothetical protein
MPNSQLPLNNTDFWWLRYFCGLVLALGFGLLAIYSLTSLHSYSPIDGIHRGIYFTSVYGWQAVAVGVTYLGVAFMLFGNCYAQYHEKMGYYYQWIAGTGALTFAASFIWFLCTFFYR